MPGRATKKNNNTSSTGEKISVRVVNTNGSDATRPLENKIRRLEKVVRALEATNAKIDDVHKMLLTVHGPLPPADA